jgi:hypothetical protein
MFKHIRTKIILFSLALLSIASTPLAHAAAPGQHPLGKDCATARDISLNSDVTVTLPNTTDYAVYRMSLKQRGLLDVWIDGGTLDMWGMELLDSSCRRIPNVIADESLVTHRWAEITVPHKGMVSSDASIWTLAAGVYFVRIRPNPFGVFQARFTFHTKFIPHYGHDCDTAEPLKLPGLVRGELLYAGDREVFRVTTTETGRIHAWTTGPLVPPRQPVIKLIADRCSTGPELHVCNESTHLVTPILKPGTYYLSVEPGGPNYLGRFTLHVEFEKTMNEVTQSFPFHSGT